MQGRYDAIICVGAVSAIKGHDVLLDALETIVDLPWRCVCVGSLDREPRFAEAVLERSRDGRLGGRVAFPGPRTGAGLERSYAAADLVVLASRAEAYGMVVAEALNRRELTRYIALQISERAPSINIAGFVENLDRRLHAHESEMENVYYPAAAPRLTDDEWRVLEAARPSE